jgi:hypothetical protein
MIHFGPGGSVMQEEENKIEKVELSEIMHWDSSAQIVTWRKINMTQSCRLVMQRVV